MRRFAVVLAIPLGCLSGCATGPSPSRVATLNSFIGKPEDALLRSFGVPNASYTTGDRTFLAFDEGGSSVIAGMPPPFNWYGWPWYGYAAIPPVLIENGCETSFEIVAGKVASWTLRGNDCS
jgi:hypothetical protein